MTFPEEELPAVAEASHKVVQEAKDAGVWIFGGGLKGHEASVVATDGTTDRIRDAEVALFASVAVPRRRLRTRLAQTVPPEGGLEDRAPAGSS